MYAQFSNGNNYRKFYISFILIDAKRINILNLQLLTASVKSLMSSTDPCLSYRSSKMTMQMEDLV